MKARDVLERYANGQRDFEGVTLKGQSFKGKQLSNANFSEANIQGADFTDADLTGVSFERAKAGLQRRWKIIMIAISWSFSWLSGRLVGFSVIFLSSLFNVSSETFNIWDFLDNPIIFVVVFSILGTAIVTVLLAGGMANALGVATCLVVENKWTLSIPITIAVVVAWRVVAASSLAQATPITFILTEIYVLLSAYLGWSTITLENHKFWIRPLSLSLASWKGTCFQGANLADANLSYAQLRNTNFKDSILTRTYWYHGKKLEFLRTGKTYLSHKKIRNLVKTGNGQKKDFEGLNLREINLSQANFREANLIDVDFSTANLQKADFSGANLVRVNFDQADLREACLTGSCIQDWIITQQTKLDGIHCDYVFLKWVDGSKRDQMPPRENFKKGGFGFYSTYYAKKQFKIRET